MLLFVYAPVLVSFPILLVIGSVFFVVTGGFIIVLGGLYLALTWLIGLVGLAATRRWGAHRARKRAARADVVPVRRAGNRGSGRLMLFASPRCHSRSEVIEGTDRLRTCPVARRADGVPQLEPAEFGPIRGSDDRRQAA